LSKDGKWRSFPKVPHLLQYVSNGNYYGRIKMGGKLIRESLQGTNFGGDSFAAAFDDVHQGFIDFLAVERFRLKFCHSGVVCWL
jgi:hypothetical protein